MMNEPRPTLIYDGQCEMCAWWVRYWQRLSGDRVAYQAYQQALATLPNLREDECRKAVQLLHADGRHLQAAAACFGVLASAGQPFWQRCYRISATFAAFSEFAYSFIATRREAFAVVSKTLWGSERIPATYHLAGRFFITVIGLIYCAAFISLAVQIEGLIGPRGILPASDFLEAVQAALSQRAWWRVPTVFWLNSGSIALLAACLLGALAGLFAAFAKRPTAALVLCYLLYLSLFNVGREFMSFQWDLLLLEAGFLSIFLNSGTQLVTTLFRLLLFRFMFLSGCVKLLSGDPSWAALSALEYHYQTQPLPTPLAWYAHHLPAWFDHLCVAGTFVVELALPFLIFAPRRPRMLAALGFVGLEVIIALTGNYTFFNLLTIALVIFLIDDGQFNSQLPPCPPLLPTLRKRIGVAIAIPVVLLNGFFMIRPFAGGALPQWANNAVAIVQPWRITNGYGLFAVMTTKREEIEIQGSDDGKNWQPYKFRYKPGEVTAPLRWVIPHQPRLDWQMWFAALSAAERNQWFGNLLLRLLQNESSVVGLFDHVPFRDRSPPLVRAVLYDYRFTTPAERARDGAIWHRRQIGMYYPAVKLQ